jgi:hypothetical protein
MPEPEIDEALLILERLGSRSALQSADIILGDTASVTAAARWIDATFAADPGCVVAGAYHRHGTWGAARDAHGVADAVVHRPRPRYWRVRTSNWRTRRRAGSSRYGKRLAPRSSWWAAVPTACWWVFGRGGGSGTCRR